MSGLGLALWMMHLSSTSSSSFTTSSDPALMPTSSALVGGTEMNTVRQGPLGHADTYREHSVLHWL